ncbi:MAG: hypothetical protein H7338_10630 [Candidatus Sericytochromatia bacterium]|nr:hypothetical protein [Candidatus Sericytochromatia bacterium]
MSLRSWFPATALAAPILIALVASCTAGGGNPFSAYVLPQALPSPVLGYGTLMMTVDGASRRFERAVFFTPGGAKFGIRPDEIGAQQRKDIFVDEVVGQQMNFRMEVPGLVGDGRITDGTNLEISDRRTNPPTVYKGPISVFLQSAGRRRGLPVLGTFSGTLTGTDGKQITVSDGQFYGHLATDV